MKFRNLLLYLVLVFTPSVYFTFANADEDTVEEKEKAEQQKNTAPTPKISSGKRSEIKTLEEFIPSEEVSADKPVTFPTDI